MRVAFFAACLWFKNPASRSALHSTFVTSQIAKPKVVSRLLPVF
ncbi:unnamed protein product [Callosobruchus maculatus]|uniref:Uncharacterized protein n=1 Tax=Callosobruchus maculatus TaxID=64391 RepID=A0A653CLP9_CALMS|nr:unnamed protein product [Callosobruchus maculatus]